MTIYSFKEFIGNLITEALHPELQAIVSSNNSSTKKGNMVRKIKELSERGEKTGIEGNMPQGSSRAYLQHEEPHQIILDDKPTSIKTGTKIAIRASLDKHHYGPMRLGNMQNEAENGDWMVNREYRILKEEREKGHFTTNKETGIFPPLIDHDEQNHEWSHVGHVDDLKSGDFRKLTKNADYPKGISHMDFFNALDRYDRSWNGKYWKGSDEDEKHLDYVSEHPLVQKFVDYHGNFGAPVSDYIQKKNLGVWEHPDGSKHIVARDHGFSSGVMVAYRNARMRSLK